ELRPQTPAPDFVRKTAAMGPSDSKGIRWRLSVLGRNVLLQLPTLRALNACWPAFKHLAWPNSAGVEQSIIAIVPHGKAFEVWLDGHLCVLTPSEEGLAPALTTTFFELCIAHVPYRMAIHAAAVEWRGRAVLLPGATGAGKSLLSACLARSGFG